MLMKSLFHELELRCDHDFGLSLEPYEVDRHFLKANSTCLESSVKSGSLGLARWLMKVFVTESEDLGLIPGNHRVKVSSSENYDMHMCAYTHAHTLFTYKINV